jgi:hypothetical protein
MPLDEPESEKSDSGFAPSVDYSDILNSILV